MIPGEPNPGLFLFSLHQSRNAGRVQGGPRQNLSGICAVGKGSPVPFHLKYGIEFEQLLDWFFHYARQYYKPVLLFLFSELQEWLKPKTK